MPTLGTFNANNFFLRYRFAGTYAGDRSKVSQVPESQKGELGFLPGLIFGQFQNRYVVWDPKRRDIGARALRAVDDRLPDILCVQEVENIQSLRVLNERHFNDHYSHIVLIDGHDNRGIDVGVLARFPLENVTTYVDEPNAAGDRRLFSRDCLELDVRLSPQETLTLFVNHFKSKFIQRKKNESNAKFQARLRAQHAQRKEQADKVSALVTARFPAPTDALFAVVGDFNDTASSDDLADLFAVGQLQDVCAAHLERDDQWTYYWRAKNRVSQIDFILASPRLAQRIANQAAANPARPPHIERRGIGWRKINAAGNDTLPARATFVRFEPDDVTPLPAGAPQSSKVDFRFPRFPEVRLRRELAASDHCPVKVWF